MRVLRSSLVLISLAVLASATSAQAGGILGARLGTSISNISGNVGSTVDLANKNGFTGTAFLQMGDGMVSVQPELGYVQKGFKEKISATDFQFNYAEVAGLVKVGVPAAGFHPHAFAGVGADINVSNVLPSGTSVDVKNLDWNAIFGGDVMMNMMGLNVVADARYAMGLNDVTSANSVTSDIKNRAWMISAGAGIKF
jgi:hypothetical protein